MTEEIGGEDVRRLAPVTPLFGSRRLAPTGQQPDEEDDHEVGEPSAHHPARGGQGRIRRWEGPAGSDSSSTDDPREAVRTRLRALRPHETVPETRASTISEPEAVAVREAAEEVLVRRLRGRSLSVAEARAVLRGESLEDVQIDDVITEFRRRGYLDDTILAGHLVTSGVERKGLGRVALSRALSQRGIPRDVIDATLSELPDDDEERALDYARSKARSLSRLDGDTALRRLVGQLARRGYNGAVAMSAARTALRESAAPPRAGGVRFVESD